MNKNKVPLFPGSKRVRRHLTASKTQVTTCLTMNHSSQLEPALRPRTSPDIRYLFSQITIYHIILNKNQKHVIRSFTFLDEIIRQVTVNCCERGLLLLRVRDEMKMTIAAYQTLYESSIAFGIRKALQVKLVPTFIL